MKPWRGGVGPLDDGTGGFTVGMGLHTSERFQGDVWYTVDGSGHLTVTVQGTDVVVPAKVLTKVQGACKR